MELNEKRKRINKINQPLWKWASQLSCGKHIFAPIGKNKATEIVVETAVGAAVITRVGAFCFVRDAILSSPGQISHTVNKSFILNWMEKKS